MKRSGKEGKRCRLLTTSRGNERLKREIFESYASSTISAVSPLWWLAPPPLPRRSRGTMGAGHFRQPVLMAVTEENHTTGLRPWEMHPFWCLRHHFPRRGKSALRSAYVLIRIAMVSIERISPTGGDAVGRRGAFPSRRRPGWPVFPPARQGQCY